MYGLVLLQQQALSLFLNIYNNFDSTPLLTILIFKTGKKKKGQTGALMSWALSVVCLLQTNVFLIKMDSITRQ